MSKKKNKVFRPKARRPRGFEDKPAELLRAERKLIDAAFAVYDMNGFEPLQTPAFEFADALGKFLPDEDRPNVGVFAGPAADTEMIMLAAEVMRAAGLKDGQYAIRVNNRKLLDGILESSGVPNTEEGAIQRLQVLRAIDKLDRLGEAGVEALLGEGREDDSGDYTKGAGLNPLALSRTSCSRDRL